MGSRNPGPPPVLPGYTYVRPLGTGGFADVFLYQQSMPRRSIAVKVLLTDAVHGDLRTSFLQETATMAHLATHPHVLTMYEAGIAADGRPYLVTEYCPGGYARRFRQEHPLPVAEVLATGIAVGSALETAHRAGVLHRDIKPANVLITEFGNPVLSDFGIAATIDKVASPDAEPVGLSIPWSPPEMLHATTAGTVATEIWSFGATLHALLAGASPFEVGDRKQDGPQQIAMRIVGKGGPAKITRADAPRALLDVIRQCMQTDPAKRPGSMMEVLHRLQVAETELGLRPTPLDVPADPRLHAGYSYESEPVAVAGTPSGRLASLGRQGSRRVRSDDVAGGGGLLRRRPRVAAVAQQASLDDATRFTSAIASHKVPRRRWPWVVVSAAALVFAAVATLLVIRPWAVTPGEIESIEAASSARSVEFSWTAKDVASGAQFQVQVEGEDPFKQEGTTYSVKTTQPGQRVCVTVRAIKDDRLGPPSVTKCGRPSGGR